MIGIIFHHHSSPVEVRVDKDKVIFRTTPFTPFVDIEGIKLDKAGSLREFPDLKDNKDWEKITRQRFKDKMKTMKTEKERALYLIVELTKFGYQALHAQREGFRPAKIRWDYGKPIF